MTIRELIDKLEEYMGDCWDEDTEVFISHLLCASKAVSVQEECVEFEKDTGMYRILDTAIASESPVIVIS